jgi:hypothetical protein
MAQIKDVKLQINPGSATTKKVTVDFKLVFGNAEIGKTFRYDINLRGEDKPDDDKETGLTMIGGQLISDFTFGIGLPSKLITASLLEQSFTETRNISTQKLNEDPGFDFVFNKGQFPHADEIFAEVILNRSFKQDGIIAEMTAFVAKKRSPTVSGFFA